MIENKILYHNYVKKVRTLAALIQSIMIFCLVVLIMFLMYEINNLNGTARVINYSGLVRGGTQRAVKLEICKRPNDALIQYLDDILHDLNYEGGQYNLVKLNDKAYLEKLDYQIEYWEELKREIMKVRNSTASVTDIVSMSETYFYIADETVSAAEKYSEKTTRVIRNLEIASAINMALLIGFVIYQMYSAIRINMRNKVLEKKAYLDLHTELPNKSKCEELLNDDKFIDRPVACFVFDLNDLKKANDTWGHTVGDQMILSFAKLLKKVFSDQDFIGRYGGDEFVGVMYDSTIEKVENLLNELQEETARFNEYNSFIDISYACGFAMSVDYDKCTLRMLFDQADQNMYDNKIMVKKRRKSNTNN